MKAWNVYVNIGNWEPAKNEWLGFLSLISSAEKERIGRYVFKKNSKQAIVGQVLIKYCIECILAQPDVEITLARNEYDKPFIKNSRSLFRDRILDFNLSHSESFVIISIIYDVPSDFGFSVGCDVMKVGMFHYDCDKLTIEESAKKQIDQFYSIIENEFTDKEIIFINLGESSIDKLLNFYRIWCLKESYAKSIGQGLYFGLKRINCLIESNLNLEEKTRTVTDTKVLIDEKYANAEFHEQIIFNTEAGFPNNIYIMTVCLLWDEKNKLDIKQVPFEQVSIQHLIEYFKIKSNKKQNDPENYWDKFLEKK